MAELLPTFWRPHSRNLVFVLKFRSVDRGGRRGGHARGRRVPLREERMLARRKNGAMPWTIDRTPSLRIVADHRKFQDSWLTLPLGSNDPAVRNDLRRTR